MNAKRYAIPGMVLATLLAAGCATVSNIQTTELAKGAPMSVLPLRNNTETPMAGLRAGSIVEGVLRARGFNIVGSVPQGKEEPSADNIAKLTDQARKAGARYVVSGDVNEWRYKTGIDGEPAVSLSISVVSLENGAVAWSGVGAKSGWGHESIGTLAQELVNGLINKIKSTMK